MSANRGYDYYPPRDQAGPPAPPPEYQEGWKEPPPPPQGPPPMGPPRPSRDIMRPKIAAIVVLVGVIIFFVGTIIVQSIVFIKEPDIDDYDIPDEIDDYYDDLQDHEDKQTNVFGVGRILNWVGIMIIVIPLFAIGTGSERLDWKIRASMLSAATALVIVTMIVSIIYMIEPF